MNKPAGPLSRATPRATSVPHFSFPPPFTDENAQKQADDLGAQFTDKFIQDSEHVTLLLTLLEVLNCFCSGDRASVLKHMSGQLPNECVVVVVIVGV